ncbi:MAG: hypothetical protein ACKV0T_22545 [Planctomycetales bacterium]
MYASLMLLGAILAADPWDESAEPTIFADSESVLAHVLRGQSPQPMPTDNSRLAYQSSSPLFGDLFGNGGGYDPFLDPSPQPGMEQFPAGPTFGAVGPQPYRFGWTSRFDIGYMPPESVSGGGAQGSFSIYEFNSAWRYTTGWPSAAPQAIFSWTPEFNHRSWSGPTDPGLPPNVYRFGSDFELATPGNAPVSLQLGFTPALVTDFEAGVNRDTFNFDGRGILFLRSSQELQFVLGAAYWNRVDNLIIPYVGVVWTPTDRWEFRLLYPKSRISYFLGDACGCPMWVYGGVEYNVEAYQIGLTAPNGQDEKIQIADYRALFGLRAEHGHLTGFIEAGWVFDRQVEFLHGTPGFDINTGFIGRFGIRY